MATSDFTPNVVRAVFSNPDRQPQLTDAELIAVRAMLAHFGQVCGSCPIARGILERGEQA